MTSKFIPGKLYHCVQPTHQQITKKPTAILMLHVGKHEQDWLYNGKRVYSSRTFCKFLDATGFVWDYVLYDSSWVLLEEG